MSAKIFLEELTNQLKPFILETNLAYWELNTIHSPVAEDRYLHSKKQLLKLYSNTEIFRDLKQLYQTHLADPLEIRQIELLHNALLMYQIPPDLMEEIISLENTIENIFIAFRAPLGFDTVSDNDLCELLAHTTDNSQAQAAWQAGKLVGQEVAPMIVKLAVLRNQAARILGFKNFFELSLFCNELNPADLINFLDQIAQFTTEPFLRFKHKLDQELADKFGVTVGELKPWNYGDPFFQTIPQNHELDLDTFFKIDLLRTASRFYQEIGLNPLPILTKSDFYERPGKSQHAFCTDIDQNGDVRILCNLRPNKYWMSTLLHELGHGVYDLNYQSDLPYLLRTPAHILTTEAIAMLMGRLTENPFWLQEYLAVPESEIKKIQPLLQNEMIKGELIFIRWSLVMIRFESQLYQNPHQDLNSLWWDLVEHYQKLIRPSDRNQPDWAAKIHLGTAPVYYQNYLLGQCAASQISDYILQNVSPTGLFMKDDSIGKYLIEQIFKPGSRYHWNQLIRQATGDWLTPSSLKAEVTTL